jgi:hypothetical protein
VCAVVDARRVVRLVAFVAQHVVSVVVRRVFGSAPADLARALHQSGVGIIRHGFRPLDKMACLLAKPRAHFDRVGEPPYEVLGLFDACGAVLILC